MAARKIRNTPLFVKLLIIFFAAAFLVAGIIAYNYYLRIFRPNVTIEPDQTAIIYIPSGADFAKVLNILDEKNILINSQSFEWVADKKNYPNQIKPGKYVIEPGMNNNTLINKLRSGKQTPVHLIFNNIRTKEQLAGRVGAQIEADSIDIMGLMNNNEFLDDLGFNTSNILAMFLPNTYEFFWNTSAEAFMKRMHREYGIFWNDDRLAKAGRIELSPVEVSVLASIVQAETSKRDEMARIAGVYINRLRRGMLLQADPTVVYAWGNFSIRRVLYKHLQINSPYNTYMYPGLPPGPINLPEPYTIDSVLNYETHNYLFFSAKEDFSGYHVFARTHSQHIVNARRYHNALNKKQIR